MKNEIKLEMKEGHLVVFHNGTCVPFCKESPSYTIDDFVFGRVYVHTSVVYWDDWDYVRLYVDVFLYNTLDIKMTTIDIPLDEIENFQTLYDKEVEGCIAVIKGLLGNLSRAAYRLMEGEDV